MGFEQLMDWAQMRPVHVAIINLLISELEKKINWNALIVTDRMGDHLSHPIYKLTVLLDKLDNPLLLPNSINATVVDDTLVIWCVLDVWHIGLNRSIPLSDPQVFEKACDIILNHIQLRRDIENNNDITLANRTTSSL